MPGRTFQNWNKIGRLLQISGYKIQSQAKKALEECAQIYYQEILRLIDEGLSSWAPLSEDWVKRKGHANFYQYKMDFVSKIEIRGVKGQFRGQKIFIGASPYRTHYSGIRMDEFSEILQFDYDRPLFGPAYENVRHEIEQKLARVGAVILKR